MKKWYSIILALVFSIVLLSPITVTARSYTVGETDLSINIDDTAWYVFTRNNIRNNSELDDLDITYEYMYDLMHKNEIFLDAIIFYEDSNEYLELFLRKRDVNDIENLSNHSDKDVLELTKKLANKQGSTDYSIYKTQYKFMKMEYFQSGYYVMEYSTVMNGDNYTLTFQTESPFSEWEYGEMDDIVDSIVFDVSSSSESNKSNSSPLFDGLWEKFIGGAVIAGVFCGTPFLYKLGKKKKEEAIQKGKVYYGLLGCRVLGLFILGVISSEMILMLILGDSVEGMTALLLMLLASIPFTVLYVYLYKKSFEKKLQKVETVQLPTTTNIYKDSSAVTSPVQPVPTAKVSPVVNENGKAGNYDYIKSFFGISDVSGLKNHLEQQIAVTTDKYNLTRKTDLMKIVFTDISKQFENRQNINVDMMISSYYQIAFDVITVQNNDMNDLLFAYSVSKVSDEISPSIHRYLQMLVRIQFIIDDAIFSSSRKGIGSTSVSKNLRIQVMNELNAYIDDTSDWNKLVR